MLLFVEIFCNMVRISAVLFFLFLVGVVYPQSKLLLGMDDLSSTTYSEIGGNEIGRLEIIYGKDIYPNDPLKVDLTSLTRAINKAFPKKNAGGYGMLDWEGKAYQILAQSKSENSAFKQVRAEFIKAISYAQKLRPNVKWGFFEIPFRGIRFANEKAKLHSHNQIIDLLKQCDVLYPSMYGYTPDNIGNLDDVSYALSLASKLDKRVYPLVWHRYQGDKNSRTKRYWFEIIPKSTFVNRIKQINTVRYKGRAVDGVVWWGRDTYFYTHKNAVVTQEARNITDFKMKYNKMVKDYIIDIKK